MTVDVGDLLIRVQAVDLWDNWTVFADASSSPTATVVTSHQSLTLWTNFKLFLAGNTWTWLTLSVVFEDWLTLNNRTNLWRTLVQIVGFIDDMANGKVLAIVFALIVLDLPTLESIAAAIGRLTMHGLLVGATATDGWAPFWLANANLLEAWASIWTCLKVADKLGEFLLPGLAGDLLHDWA